MTANEQQLIYLQQRIEALLKHIETLENELSKQTSK